MKRNLFNSVKLTRPKKSKFDLSHQVVTTMDAGWLTPVMQPIEMVPSDSFNLGGQIMVRMSPMLAPLMWQVDCSMHYFFVPSRLLWPNFENYITQTLVAGTLPAFPTIDHFKTRYDTFPLFDYMGLPDPVTLTVHKINALPFSGYQMIWNDFYRDQNLQAAIPFELTDGDNTANTDLFTRRRVAWEHDMFTAALPTAQKGAAVDIPLGNITLDNSSGVGWIVRDVTGVPVGSAPINSNVAGGLSFTDVAGPLLTLDPNGTLVNDPTTINELRRAYRLQEWLERAMLGGSRYVENILAFFGIRSQDSRLQRPEYITGTKTTIGISEVTSSAETSTLPQGNMSGHGIAFDNGNAGHYFAHEHGYLYALMFIRPKTGYYQGIDRMWNKTNDPFEFFWPQFANIGEQAVLNKEVYAPHTTPNGTFGYVPRYAEYKFMHNRVTGDMKNSLDFWQWARKFSSDPSLNSTFVQCAPDDRPFAVPSSDSNFYVTAYHRINAVRPMPYFGTPTI